MSSMFILNASYLLDLLDLLEKDIQRLVVASPECLSGIFFLYISRGWNLGKNMKKYKGNRLSCCDCDTEILLLVCWYIQQRIHDMEKNPSSNTCLISAGRSRATERAELD